MGRTFKKVTKVRIIPGATAARVVVREVRQMHEQHFAEFGKLYNPDDVQLEIDWQEAPTLATRDNVVLTMRFPISIVKDAHSDGGS